MDQGAAPDERLVVITGAPAGIQLAIQLLSEVSTKFEKATECVCAVQSAVPLQPGLVRHTEHILKPPPAH